MNYSVQEYARDVVFTIHQACEHANIEAPIIITESGRAMMAHHAVLITEVIDVAASLDPHISNPQAVSSHPILEELYYLHGILNLETCHEVFHDAQALKEKILEIFNLGHLHLAERACAEHAYRLLIAKIYQLSQQLAYIPDDLKQLESELHDIYFCNFSVFQSLPDVWAINQVFPVTPIHRLNEEPTRQAIIADMSCDSDGKIDHFIGNHQEQNYLKLHTMNHSPYYLGVFLVGAYQEILGGLHNLFGDANAVHIDLKLDGNWEVKHLVEGDTIEEVLGYAQYHVSQLRNQLHVLIEKGIKEGVLSTQESAQLQKKFKESLESYTYLTV